MSDDDEPGVPGLGEPAVPGLYPQHQAKKQRHNNKHHHFHQQHQPPWKKTTAKSPLPKMQPSRPTLLTRDTTSQKSFTTTVVSKNLNPVTPEANHVRAVTKVAGDGRSVSSLTGNGEVRMVKMDMIGDSLVSSHSVSARIKNTVYRIQVI